MFLLKVARDEAIKSWKTKSFTFLLWQREKSSDEGRKQGPGPERTFKNVAQFESRFLTFDSLPMGGAKVIRKHQCGNIGNECLLITDIKPSRSFDTHI